MPVVRRVHNQSGGITLYDCRYCRKSGYNCAKKLRVIKSNKFPKIYIETTPDDHDHEPKCVLTKGMKLTPEAKNLILALYDECEKPAQILKELLPVQFLYFTIFIFSSIYFFSF